MFYQRSIERLQIEELSSQLRTFLILEDPSRSNYMPMKHKTVVEATSSNNSKYDFSKGNQLYTLEVYMHANSKFSSHLSAKA